jgi:hypothetical protein
MEDESSAGGIWAPGFQDVMACSHLVLVLKVMNVYFFIFHYFISGRGKPRIQNRQMRGCDCTKEAISGDPVHAFAYL